jgi:hypothetical protein
MSVKPASKSRFNFLASFLRGAKGFSAGLSDRAVIDALVGVFIIVALSILLMRDYQRPPIEPLAPGAIAPADVIAPRDFKTEDTDETNRLRAQAAQSVLSVFDYNPKIAREVRQSIERMFIIGRESAEASSDQLRADIEEASGIILDPDQLDVLRAYRFNNELEKLMIDHLESIMIVGVVDRRTHLVKYGAIGIHRRDLRTKEEMVITDISSIPDQMIARAALRSEKLLFPAEYTRVERQLIGEVMGSVITPNLLYNEAETEARRERERKSVVPVIASVERGKPIVVEGETVTGAKSVLLKLASAYRPIGQRAVEFAGTVVIVMMLMLVLWQYLLRYQQRHLRVRRHFLLQVACFVITLGLARLFFPLAFAMSQSAAISPFNSEMAYKYLAPLALGAALITLLTDAHAAFVFAAILSVFVGALSGNVYLAAYTLTSSVGAIYYLQSCRDRTAMVRAGVWMGLVNAAAALALDLLSASAPALTALLFDSFCGMMSGLIAAMVASLLLPLFEWLFEITTSIKLLELSNLNLPLLRQLAERAPGTYHHSIMVGLLAEAGTEAIGGDALFARVACYYHDIGKSIRPTYFVENQSAHENRHDNLSPRMSSIVLINHVKQGIEIARQHKLPPRIIAIIPQHHGTGLMKYFYYKARKDMGDSAALEQEFRYPGPRPQTKEAAVIMIADSVEAAARTVQNPTPTKLRNMIDLIITRIRDDGQFDECDITLREMKLVADSFVKVLVGIHHHRIAYPGYDFNRAGAPALLSQVAPIEEAKEIETAASIPTVAAPDATASKASEARGD